MTLKASIRAILILSAFATTSCHSKDSIAIRRPFCNIYDFTIRNDKYQLTLMRDTSGGFPTYDGMVHSATTSDFISINPEGVDSARPDALRFDLYGKRQQGFSFSGTVSPDGSTIEGFVKLQQQTTAIDSVRCTMKESRKLPLAFFVQKGDFRAGNDSAAGSITFVVNLLWPKAGIPAITAMKYKKDVVEWLELKGNIHNYSAEECLKQYRQNFVENYVNDTDLTSTPGYNRDEEVGTNLHYIGEKWMTISFYNSFHDQLMAHHQGGTKFMMYDMRTGNHPGLRHFFTPEGLRRIPVLLTKYFRIENDLKPGELLTKTGLYDNYIHPNNNYFVTSEALHFYYNAYEIAPYAYGEFHVAIPLSEFGAEFRYQPN